MNFHHPISFEEARTHIVDPNYGLGLIWLWQLASAHPFHKAGQLHDLRYDYLEPGEDTAYIDHEFYISCWKAATTPFLVLQAEVFKEIARARGRIFIFGEDMCRVRNCHIWAPCTYGQNKIYNERCTTCGLHKDL